jgi:hypothetical protein
MFRRIPLIFLIIITGCEFFRPKQENAESAIARVNETYLYPSDFVGLIPSNLNPEDSGKFAQKFVDDWVKKQLMIARSQREVDINEAEIQKKVLDYTYALTRSAYERKYIQENLNEAVSDEQIQKYYDENAEDFILKQNIVRCLFAQIPKEAPRLNRFRNNLADYPNEGLSELKEYCTQFANRAFVEDSVWVNFKEVIAGTPYDQSVDQLRLLRSRQQLENSDDTYTYFLRILDYKVVDDTSPIEFVREDIINILINKRKIALKRELEDKVYEDAAANDAFEIFDR